MKPWIFRNPNIHGVYKWCVRYHEGKWSDCKHFKTREEAEAFAKTKETNENGEK